VDNLITVQEAAEVIGCSGRSVHNFINEQRLSSEKIGFARMLYRDEVERFAEAYKLVKGRKQASVEVA